MSKPIILWTADKRLTTDDAGTGVIKSTLPLVPPPGPYEEHSGKFPRPLGYVPPLSHFCLRQLALYPEHIHHLGKHRRLLYARPKGKGDYDAIRALVPGYRPERETFDWSFVDPRLWATIVQAFFDLPDNCYRYGIPLSDKYLPLLQQIPWSGHFSLVIVLELCRCHQLTDDSITSLKYLPNLAALDASETTLTSNGIGRLARSLSYDADLEDPKAQARGPWQLRILRLCDCKKITDNVLMHLQEFRLLSVIDLRGTSCTRTNTSRQMQGFFACPHSSLFSPTLLADSLQALQAIQNTAQNSPEVKTARAPCLFPSQKPFVLVVDRLHHPKPRENTASNGANVLRQDGFTVFPSNNPKPTSFGSHLTLFGKPKAVQNTQTVQMGEVQRLYREFTFEDDRARKNEEIREAERLQLRERQEFFDTENYDRFCGGPSPNSSSDVGSQHEDTSDLEGDILRPPSIGALSEQPAAMFYASRASSNPSLKLRSSLKEQHAKDTENIDPLALFRLPPSWPSPNDTAGLHSKYTTAKLVNRGKQSQFDNSHSSLDFSTVAAKSINRDLTDMINKRRRITQSDSLGESPRPPSGLAPGLSRNPFLRKAPVTAASFTVSSTAAQISVEGGSSSKSVNKKSLRPLSSLPIPLPPSPLRIETSPPRHPKKTMNQKREEFIDNFSSVGTSTENDEAASKSTQEGRLIGAGRKKSAAKQEKKEGRPQFNWEGWSKKS